MMWHIKVICGEHERNVRIISDRCEDLLSNGEFNYANMVEAVGRGECVRIHYEPNRPGMRVGVIRGTKRIIKKDGMFFFSIDGKTKGRGYSTRREAWEAKGR